MLSKHSRVTVALFVFASLAACQQSQPDVVATPVSGQATAPVAQQVSRSNVSFTVTPDVIKQCPGAEPVAAEVTWLVSDMAVTEVKVEVVNAGQSSRKLLSLAGRQGKAATEAWVVVGTKFFLTDSKTGQELASFEMQGQSCK